MRKLNVNRIRRYTARTTPDVVTRKFDPLSDTYRDEAQIWLQGFRRKMIVKHGQYVRIDVLVDQEIAMHTHEVLIKAEVVKGRPTTMEEEDKKLRLNLSSLPQTFLQKAFWNKE